MDAKKLYRVAEAAKQTEANRSTLISAVRAGQVPSYPTACGLPLVLLKDVRKWMAKADTRRPGRKPAQN